MPSANARNFHVAVADHLQEELLAAIGCSQGLGVRLIPDRESLSALQWALPGEASVLIAELDWIVAAGLAPGEIVARQRTRGVQLAVVLSASRRLWTHPLLARWALENGATRLLASLSPARVEATVVPASSALMAAAGMEANHPEVDVAERGGRNHAFGKRCGRARSHLPRENLSAVFRRH